MLRQRKKRLQKTLAAILIFAGFVSVKAQTSEKARSSNAQKTAAAAELIGKGELAAAEVLLKQVIAADLRNAVAQTLAGVAAARRNDLAAAEKHFASAAKLQPNSPETRNNYGAILFRIGRTDEAAKEFQASLKANPNQPSAQINLAQIYFAKGTPTDLQMAQSLFGNVFAAAPDIEIARALVIIALRLGDKPQAREIFQQYARLTDNTGLPARSKAAFGALLLESGLLSEAAIELAAALKGEPDNVEAIVLMARVDLAQKNIKAAGQLLESAVSRGIKNGKIYVALAEVYQAGGYFENAIPAMRLAIEADKTNEAYRYRYGMLLIDTKAAAAAVVRLKESVEDFPNSAQIRLGLGIAEFYDSKLTDAQQSLEKALSFDAKLVPALAYLAAIKNAGGQSAEAAAFYERALVIDEKSAILHYLLADTLLKGAAADAVKVEKHLQRSIELDSQIAAAHLALGRLYARNKNYAAAAAEFERTVALDPNQAEAFYQLGQIYGRLKRVEDSRASLAKFKELSEREKAQTKSDYSELVRRLANVKF